MPSWFYAVAAIIILAGLATVVWIVLQNIETIATWVVALLILFLLIFGGSGGYYASRR